MTTVIDILQERGLIEATTGEESFLKEGQKVKVYCGFDPTADSLHLGNMVALMGLAWFKRFGHEVVAIVGGATGMIGDPSGKAAERQLLDEATLKINLEGIKKNFSAVLGDGSVTILNNFDWFENMSCIRFLREVGKFFRIGPMLGKESVRLRMQSEEGLSFTEFSYQLLQGYDFLHLFREQGVTVQLGGSDQWGNITAGIDLVRKVEGKSVYGLTFPLLTRSDGQKFGKSEKGAIWLSPEKISPYDFYQHLIRVEDADVIKLMRMLTFMEMEEIRSYETAMQQPGYVPRTAQKRLAEEITRHVHGQEGLEMALRVTEGLSPGSEAILDADSLEKIASEVPGCSLPTDQIVGQRIVDFLVAIGLQSSKGEAKRLISNGGIYINNKKVAQDSAVIDETMLLEGRLMLVAAGKKNKLLVQAIKSLD